LEQSLDEPHTRYAIDHAVMRLANQSKPIVFDAFDDPELPQWPASIEAL
jgi:hypothetical protein